MNTPSLNWKELELLSHSVSGALTPETESFFVDRVIIPERARFPEGYLKAEWAIRLRGRKRDFVLLFSVRPRNPYLTLLSGKGPKAASVATHSPFDLALSRHLKDARLLRIEALDRERIVFLWFSSSAGELGLALLMIPAIPEAVLVRQRATGDSEPGWPIVTRSRTLKQNEAPRARFEPPSGSNAPAEPVVRTELTSSESLNPILDRALAAEAFDRRIKTAERELRDLIKQARDRIRQSSTALTEAEAEADWLRHGELLKSALGDPPPLVLEGKKHHRELTDFATGRLERVPGDPKYGPSEQVERFFQHARRKARRIEESRARLAGAKEALERADRLLASPPLEGDWEALERFERAAGRREAQSRKGEGKTQDKSKAKGGLRWLGKTFTSKDGLAIWVGRSKDENLELTFKHARGNDLWLHVRGRPGAHAVIPLQGGKSAPLETLLDAATVTVYYSKGENWGKTEVDYTYKKYVKRIRDSTEASYTHNKTLIIEPDAVRLKRLLANEK